MPVGQRELRRGIDLGLYPDQERQQRAELAEQRAQLAEQREERMADSQDLRDKIAKDEALTKQIEFQQAQDALDLDITIKQRALEAAPKLKALNPRSKDYPLQRAAALGDDYRVGIVLKDQLGVNDDSHKGWLAIQDADQKNAATWEAEHGIEYPRKPDGTLNHVVAGRMRREGAKTRGLTEETLAPSGSTFKTKEPPKDTELPSLEKERALHVRMLDRAKRIRSKATDDDVIKDADNDIVESESALSQIESQIRSRREGGAGVAPTADFTSADEVRAAFRAGKLDRSQAEAALKNKFGLR